VHQRIAQGLVLAALAATAAPARADITGAIEGTVTDQATGKRLSGVTVTVSSPALQAEQTEFTDQDGHYLITELPPGPYLVRFYFADIYVQRPEVVVQADKTLSVNIPFPTQKAKQQVYVIKETAPNVDIGNAQVQTQVTNELVRNTPVVGRTYAAVLTLAPGAANDPVGTSFNGATGPENNFLIDGVNTTDPAFGLLGTQLTLEFIGETEIITGGYNAEYGRATGGVVNVITKTGSNTFHGDLWFNAVPFQLDPTPLGRTGEAIVSKAKTKYGFDFGFDLGGPIVKDKIWFYAGFQPTFNTVETDRLLRARSANGLPAGMTSGSYQGDLDTSTGCPAGLAAAFCSTPNLLQPAYATHLLDPSLGKTYTTDTRLYNWIVKLNFQLNPNNSLVVQYIGSPQTTNGLVNGSVNGQAGQQIGSLVNQTQDVMAHYVSKLADRHLQLDAQFGYHYADANLTPNKDLGGNGPGAIYAQQLPLNLFESTPSGCTLQKAHGVSFDPCPVQNYLVGGFGFVPHTQVQRVSAAASATYFARLGGTHALKLGFDFEDNMYTDSRIYTSGAFYEVDTTGAIIVLREWASKDPNTGPNGQGIAHIDGFTTSTSTLNYGAYLRDSYNVSFVPGLTLNAGLRYEAQQVKGTNGEVAIGIYDNWAPRVGAIYDFTRKGRSKLYVSYGWFYESVPLDINDRQFSNEGILQGVSPSGTCMPQSNGLYNLSSCGPSKMFPNGAINGGTYSAVSPTLQGQYSEEVVAGLQYDVGLDLVLGASYIHRDLGRIIEDMSPDGGNHYIIANPGQQPDEGAIKNLQNQIMTSNDPVQKAQLQQRLGLYQNVANGFPKPVRNYDALVITATKRLSHNFLLLASYTYSRTLGNYPGTYQASDFQLDPNISTQYDVREQLFNRSGPLPNDRPHNLKLTGSYFIPFGANHIVIGATFTMLSGTPIEVLGRSPTYGPNESFILPRGSGGRTPLQTQLDLHVAYRRQLGRVLGFETYADVFNILNEQAATAVDNVYTASSVDPIVNGKVADLANLKTSSGTQPLLNPNYGHPTAFQAPLSMRLGVRLSF
jgi:hypothetical protein